MMKRFVFGSAIILLMFFMPMPGLTANFDWTGAYDSNWDDVTNWSEGGSPAISYPSTSLDNVSIPSGTPSNPMLTSPTIINSLTIDGIGARLTVSSSSFYVYGGVFIENEGAMEVYDSNLYLGTSGLVVNAGGCFWAENAGIYRSTGTYYSIDINDGSFYWDKVILKGCSETYISPSATISEMREVDFLESDGSTTTAHLFIDRAGNSNENFTFDLIIFDSTKGYNCHLIGDNTINVTFTNYGGTLSGETYELGEGGAIIDWIMGAGLSVDITYPEDGSSYNTPITYIQGTSSGTVDYVEVSIMKIEDSTYWDGSVWNTSEVRFTPIDISTWALDTSGVYWQDGCTYKIKAYATDISSVTVSTEITFIYGATSPLESIYGIVTMIEETPITGVIITARRNESIIATATSETDGSFEIEDLPAGWYSIEASWSVNDITSSVEQLTHTGSIYLHFTLAIDYELAVIEGDVDGVDTYATSSCPSRLRSKSLSPKAGFAFVELEKNDNVIVRVAVDTSGHYQIPNLLPGTYTARAYNGRIYSKSKTIKIEEGQRLSIDFSFPLDLKESSVYNYPNPACESYTVIRYSCPNPNHRAKIRIFTISGELVREIKDSEIDGSQAPVYEYRWDLENDRGRGISSGIYLYILELEEKSSGETEQVTKKLAIVR